MDPHDVLERSTPPELVPFLGADLLANLRVQPFDPGVLGGIDRAREISVSGERHRDADGALLLDEVTTGDVRLQRELSDVAHRVTGRSPLDRRVVHVNVEILAPPHSAARDAELDRHLANVQIARLEREERDLSKELDSVDLPVDLGVSRRGQLRVVGLG